MSRYIRLEYSEQQQCFHFGYPDEPENTNGYITIESQITRKDAQEFIEEVRSVNSLLGNERLSIEFVINYSSIHL